jgi:ribosome recycling factor
MIEDILRDSESKMSKSIEVLEHDLGAIRTGRASPSLVERLSVDYYGTPTPLNQLASISVQEAKVIMIQPWDKQAMGEVEKAILKSDLGLTPNNDGASIRLNIPPLTEERRRDLAKVVRKRVEDGKVAIRNVRRDGVDGLRGLEKNKEISQDEQRRAQDQIQKLTDTYCGKADEVGARKEAELMDV